MKVVVVTEEKPRVLKAVASSAALWVANAGVGVTLIGQDGTTLASKFRDLESVLKEDPSPKKPIYEGDTITITF